MTNAGMTFLSWVRTGLISNAAPAAASGNLLDAPLPLTATLPVTLAVDGGGEVRYAASVVGPGDVVGLDRRQVIRSDPAPGAVEVAPNYFALVEFDRPDLPWMLTPNAPAEALPDDADARRGLRPWLCLVVVPDQALDPPTAGRPLPRLVVSDAELPELESAWLWAHAQVLTAPGDDLQDLLANRPERTLSRLVSPRRLKPGRGYLACVVPVFEAGRRAGLGLDPAPGDTLAPAWTRGASPREVYLPVYHSWRFSTSHHSGDFERLAERMKPATFGRAGVRPLDVGHAGGGLPGPEAGEPAWEVELEGAIVGDQVEPGEWRGPERDELQYAIAERLAAGVDELAPPTYGSLQGGYDGSLEDGRGPVWMRGLNLDPRYRATASLGTRIVQQHQEALVASAWEQSAEIREANRLLRQAQLAAAVSEVIADRVKQAEPGRLLQVTTPVHGQLSATGTASALRAAGGEKGALRMESDPTVAAEVAGNVAVKSALSGAYRRAARPAGPLARRLAPADARLEAPVERLGLPVTDEAAVRPAPTLEMPAGTVDLGTVVSDPGGESLAGLTAARVATPVFPWEQGGPAAATPPRIPVGYLADLVVVTRDRASGRTAAGVGRALDFDALPQQGWEEIRDWKWPLLTAEAQVDLPAFPGFPERVGRVSFSIHQDRYPTGDMYYARTWWALGPIREVAQTRSTLANLTNGTTSPPKLKDVTVAGSDFTGTGRIDPVVGYVDEFGFPQVAVRTSAGWQTRKLGTHTTPHAPSVAAAGSQLFVLNLRYAHDPRLRIETIDGQGRLASQPAFVDVKNLLPGDTTSAVLAAADFGGGTGADLLLFFVAGEGRTRRAGYRVLYDVRPDGSVGRWGETRGARVPVAGDDVMLLLGASTRARAESRRAVTAAFRSAAYQTQLRQERLAPESAPPPPPPPVDTAQLAEDVRAGLSPTDAVRAGVAARLELDPPIDPETVSDPLQPLAITPRFPYPTFELFRDTFPDRLFPGASEIPDDCVTALRVNQAALEAFLVGLNHEMSRELLWRGFPVRHGTFFREFWDARREEITPIEGWKPETGLGSHGPGGDAEGSLLLVIRAELIRRMPDVTIYAVPATATPGGRTPDLAKRVDPLFAGRLTPDLRFFGFSLPAEVARGDDGGPGWYFVFQENPTAPRFGLNEGDTGAGTVPSTWARLSWPQVARSAAEYDGLVYADAGRGAWLSGRASIPDGGGSALSHRWGFSAAHMAHITLQLPVQVAIHASDLIARDVPVKPAKEVAS